MLILLIYCGFQVAGIYFSHLFAHDEKESWSLYTIIIILFIVIQNLYKLFFEEDRYGTNLLRLNLLSSRTYVICFWTL